MRKFVITNCPSYINEHCTETECANSLTCPLKLIIEKCKQSIEYFNTKDKAKDPYIMGRDIQAQMVLKYTCIRSVK